MSSGFSSYVIARHDFTKCRCSEGSSYFCFKTQKDHFFLSKTRVPLSCQRYGLNWVSEHFFSRRQNLRVKLPVGSSPVTPLRCCVGKSDYKMEKGRRREQNWHPDPFTQSDVMSASRNHILFPCSYLIINTLFSYRKTTLSKDQIFCECCVHAEYSGVWPYIEIGIYIVCPKFWKFWIRTRHIYSSNVVFFIEITRCWTRF